MQSVNTVLNRVQELAVTAGNGALAPEQRKAIAAELREREDELLGLMNTKNARGEYLFSGFQGKAEPFVRNADGTYSYQGDEGQRKLEIASSLSVPISDNGKKVFQDVINAGRLDAAVAAQPGSTLRASTPLVQDEVAFSGTPRFPDAGIDIVFGNPDANSYEVFAAGTTTPALATGAMDDKPDASDKMVFRGVVINFDGAPAAGDTVTVTSDPNRQKQGALDTIASLRRSLEESPATLEGNLQIRDAVAQAMTNLSHASITVDGTRGDIGARRNIIDSTLTSNEDTALANKSVQSELRELDYPEALSRLSFQTLVLEAAQQSYVKISSLNLFNKL